MATRAVEKQRRRQERVRRETELAARARRARGLQMGVAGTLLVAVAALAAIFAFGAASGPRSPAPGQPAGAGEYAYAVGDPGPGQAAPALRLPSTSGGTFDLARQRGKTTLLYFQEGLGCQPCWDQIKDLERQPDKLRALGIDQMVSITGNDLDQLRQKANVEDLRTPVLADSGLSVSATYAANQYGMMGDTANGHSFIVIDPDGKIDFRADYGGARNYTMYVPGGQPRRRPQAGHARRDIVRVTLLTQTDCGFCDQADDLVRRMAGEYALDIQTVDIASPAGQELAAEGSIMFPPGILLDDQSVLYGRPSERRLRREIERRLAPG